jgi:integration host factor subunit beta
MNKSELVDFVSQKRNLPRKRAEQLVELVFDLMVDALKRGERIEVRGFGSFEVRHRGPYEGRNPRSGTPIQVAAKKMPFFKVGKELRQRVDRSTAPLALDTDDDDVDGVSDEVDGPSDEVKALADTPASRGTPGR